MVVHVKFIHHVVAEGNMVLKSSHPSFDLHMWLMMKKNN